MKPKYDLTWGESVCVRQAFADTAGNFTSTTDKYNLMAMGYPKHEGDQDLVEITRAIIMRQTGETPKHVFLTNGATGAVVCALRAYAQHGFKYGMTPSPPYFPLYPNMVKNSGLVHCHVQDITPEQGQQHGLVFLFDSPSNPTGTPFRAKKILGTKTQLVWDAVYHNRVYMPLTVIPPQYDIMCGSYSKLTGVNGLRIGWVATNDDTLAKTLGEVITAEYVGLSAPSTWLLRDILENFNWELFETTARHNLERNKFEWSKVTKYLGDERVPLNGMFHYAPIDFSAKCLLEKAGVAYMPSESCHATPGFGRFNLGQDCTLVTLAVKSILKADRIFTL